MVIQTKGKIFLAEERGHNELDWFRSYNTFNFGQYYNEHKSPFGSLYVLNEDTLAGHQSLGMTVEEDSDILLIPVVGAIDFKDTMGNKGMVQAGEIQVLDMPKGASVEITNPYETSLVKYLQVWIRRNPGKTVMAAPRVLSFNLEDNRNRLINLFAGPGEGPATYAGAIGKFAGREEAVYTIGNTGHGLFAFVIEGVFEVQHRLLHPGDGLGVWDLQEVELEALSNDAIVLLLEVPV